MWGCLSFGVRVQVRCLCHLCFRMLGKVGPSIRAQPPDLPIKYAWKCLSHRVVWWIKEEGLFKVFFTVLDPLEASGCPKTSQPPL